MNLTLQSNNSTEEPALRENVEGCGKRVLGRLARRISHVMVSIRESPGVAGRTVHACSLRLRVKGDAETLIESRHRDRDAAVVSAFKRARCELVLRSPRMV